MLLLGALSLFAPTPAQAQPFAAPSNQLTAGDQKLTLTWDAPSWRVSTVTLRWRVKDTDPDTAGNQAGNWTPPTGAASTHVQTDARSVPIPPWLSCTGCGPSTNGVTYEVHFRWFRVDSDGGGYTGWGSVGEGTPQAPPHSHGPPPGKPTLTLVTSAPNVPTASTLSFTMVCVSSGNAPVTDYVLFAHRTSDNSALPTQFFTPVPWPCRTVTATLTGLTEAREYRVRAFGRHLVGRNSPMSDWVPGTTTALFVRGGGGDLESPGDPLTASFEEVPSEHDGKAAFALLLRLSETVGNFSKSPRKSSFAVRGGRVRSVEQAEAGLWRVWVKPGSWRDVTVTLAGGRDCDTEGAVCTPDGRELTNTSQASVGGPVRIRIKGVDTREGRDAGTDFAVTLNRALSETVSVDYATADVAATAGEEYQVVSGTLSFAAGETEKTLHVPVLDDQVDEGRESLQMRLSNGSGAFLRGIHKAATRTIGNTGRIPAALLARFGRTGGGAIFSEKWGFRAGSIRSSSGTFCSDRGGPLGARSRRLSSAGLTERPGADEVVRLAVGER